MSAPRDAPLEPGVVTMWMMARDPAPGLYVGQAIPREGGLSDVIVVIAETMDQIVVRAVRYYTDELPAGAAPVAMPGGRRANRNCALVAYAQRCAARGTVPSRWIAELREDGLAI